MIWMGFCFKAFPDANRERRKAETNNSRTKYPSIVPFIVHFLFLIFPSLANIDNCIIC